MGNRGLEKGARKKGRNSDAHISFFNCFVEEVFTSKRHSGLAKTLFKPLHWVLKHHMPTVCLIHFHKQFDNL